MTTTEARKLAIACQGGGALTAWQAGLLGELLKRRRRDADGRILLTLPVPLGGAQPAEELELVAFTGTSGGAQNAAIAWAHCAADDGAAPLARLQAWWNMVSAKPMWLGSSPLQSQELHRWLLFCMGLSVQTGLQGWTPPINLLDGALRASFVALMEDGLADTLGLDAAGSATHPLNLHVGAADALSGSFTTFVLGDNAGWQSSSATHRQRLQRQGMVQCERLSAEILMASACLPQLFGEQPLPMSDEGSAHWLRMRAAHGAPPDWPAGRQAPAGAYWDGLFSHNPPLSSLLHARRARRPDVILILRSNPRAIPRPPLGEVALADRRNELEGNLSLEQEIRAIRDINALLASAAPDRAVLSKYFRSVAVHELEAPWSLAGGQRTLDKFNRLPEHIADLFDAGRRFAAELPAHSTGTLVDLAAA